MKLYTPMIDYTTITSFLPDINNRVATELINGAEVSPIAFSGYTGARLATEFGGIAVMEGTNNAGGIMGSQMFKHYMVKFSGEVANVSPEYVTDDCHVTRMDIQITHDHPGREWLLELESRLRSGAKFNKGRGARISVTLIKSDTVTLYGGSRTSASFFRLYEKPSEDGDFLRWEYETKGKLARHYMDELIAGRTTRGGIFRQLVGEYHESYKDLVQPYLSCCDDETADKYVRTIERSTMDWLESLTPTVERMIHSHQHGERMRSLLTRWQNTAKKVDNLKPAPSLAELAKALQ